ncbi:MAG: hypothetical protein KIS87_05505 [Phycisphaeraceae bacterium]|nr:hypothetical protein [Phycisphaeraceae bacterium]
MTMKIGLVAGLALGLASAASATDLTKNVSVGPLDHVDAPVNRASDPVIYTNTGSYPNLAGSGWSSQFDTNYPFESRVADDFVLPGPANQVTGVTWAGLWWNPGPPGNATGFRVFFYNDVGGVPGQPGSANEIGSTTLTMGQITIQTGIYCSVCDDYTADINPITLNPGTKYWVTVQSINFFPPQWGWMDAIGSPANAHQGFPLLGIPYWVNNSVEQAFRLHGKQGGTVCKVDCNGDTVVNTLDFICFLNFFTAGHPNADFNGDTVVNTLDFIAFLNAFVAGCP